MTLEHYIFVKDVCETVTASHIFTFRNTYQSKMFVRRRCADINTANRKKAYNIYNYQVAWESLENQCNNKRMLVQIHVKPIYESLVKVMQFI